MSNPQPLQNGTRSDEELIGLAMVGSESAFTALYARHAHHIAGFAYRLTGNGGALDDIVQETFVDAFKYMDRLRDPALLRVWLMKIAVKKCKRHFVRQYRSIELTRELNDHDDPSSGVQMAECADIYEALGHLPEKWRVPLVLHEVEGMTLPEVSEVCGRSLATVKRYIVKATEELRRHLND